LPIQPTFFLYPAFIIFLPSRVTANSFAKNFNSVIRTNLPSFLPLSFHAPAISSLLLLMSVSPSMNQYQPSDPMLSPTTPLASVFLIPSLLVTAPSQLASQLPSLLAQPDKL